MELFVESIGIIVQCIVCMAMADKLSDIELNRKTWAVKGIFLGFNFALWFCVGHAKGIWNIAGVLLDTLGYYLYLIILKRRRYLAIYAEVMAVQVIYQIGALIVTLIVSLIASIVGDDSYYILLLLLGYIISIGLLYPFFLLNRKYMLGQILEKTRVQYIVITIGICFQLSRLMIRIYYKNPKNIIPYIALTMIVMGGIFGILWLADWHCAEREKRLLMEDNQRMSQRLHRSKEILPALNLALEKLKTEAKPLEINDILEEIHQLCKEQIEESERRDMQDKIFPTTGIHILDEQIHTYGLEAAEKGINFDVFVGIPLEEVLKEEHIKEMQFLRLIGDLMRNAIRAVERTERGRGNILLVMGCVENIFQIDIYDDGTPFPMFILDEFGKRGNTQGGTGNGIPDMIELLEEYRATLRITEYENSATFSKGISVIWDRKNGRWIDSPRSSQISQRSVLLSEKS